LLNIPFLDRAGAWFLESGIQEPSGGVARYYLADTQQNRPVSTEITGYAISALVYLYSMTQEERFLTAATSAARFLTRSAWDSQLRVFPFECSGPPLAYFFDSGIIIRGLLNLWRVTRDHELIDIAEQCGRSMARDFAAGDSGYHPILRLPEKDPLPLGEKWSRQQACYQLKAALAWHDLHKETGHGDFLKLYEDALAASLRTHDSFLPGAEGDLVMDRLHAYCYFLEASLPRAGNPEVAGALAAGIVRVSHYLREIAPRFERSDVYAQLLRVRLLTECAGGAPVDRLAAAQEAEKIESFQLDDPDRRIRGGSFFARRGGRLQPHVNPVSTAFGLQALAMWRQYLAGERQFAPGALI
jgi:Highly conserved protein containing a thioredoxin domain